METVLLSLQGAGRRPSHPSEGKVTRRPDLVLLGLLLWVGREMLEKSLTGTGAQTSEVFSHATSGP